MTWLWGELVFLFLLGGCHGSSFFQGASAASGPAAGVRGRASRRRAFGSLGAGAEVRNKTITRLG